MFITLNKNCFSWGALLLLFSLRSVQSAPTEQMPQLTTSVDPSITQQQRQQVLESQLNPSAKDVRFSLPPALIDGKIKFPAEESCYLIKAVLLEGAEELPGSLRLKSYAHQAIGHCLGGQGINLLMKGLQNSIVAKGYITTRVVAPQQNLKSGLLKLKLLPGNINKVRLSENSDSYIQLYTLFPPRSGDLLFVRDIEQGLENLQRLPGTQASMKIIPAEQLGESDIEVSWKQKKIWRLGLSVDDAGSKSTGRYQGGMTVSLDNPFSLGDLIYISGSHDLHDTGKKQSKNITGHYSVPFGYWMFGVTAYDYRYLQTISGRYQDFSYSGEIKNLNAQISRVIHRGRSHKTSFSYELIARESHNYLEDTELNWQRRRTTAWRLGLNHRQFIDRAVLDTSLSYQQGTRWFGALPAPEESAGTATALSKTGIVNVQLNVPFALSTQQFRYNARYFQQFSKTPLTSPEQLSIGNRWTVRGFDGERTLIASRGWFLRNDIAWRTPVPGQELYLGLDYGKVSGYGSQYLTGTHLAGSQLGIRGNAFNVGYDMFAAVPLSKPDAFETSKLTLGFSVSWNY